MRRVDAIELAIKDERFVARFWSRVHKTAGCWNWTGGTFRRYGAIHFGGHKGVSLRAHRVSWRLAGGALSDGAEVCHRCDNPPCVNPEHLFLGTHADNAADMKLKGRGARGSKNAATVLNEPAVRSIRSMYGTLTITEMARLFGVHRSTIQSALHRKKSWKYV